MLLRRWKESTVIAQPVQINQHFASHVLQGFINELNISIIIIVNFDYLWINEFFFIMKIIMKNNNFFNRKGILLSSLFLLIIPFKCF